MGFMASSPGKGRMEPYLQEQHDLQVEMQKKMDAVAGSPSPQLDSTGDPSSNSDAPVLPRPKGSVAVEMRSRSPKRSATVRVVATGWAAAAAASQPLEAAFFIAFQVVVVDMVAATILFFLVAV